MNCLEYALVVFAREHWTYLSTRGDILNMSLVSVVMHSVMISIIEENLVFRIPCRKKVHTYAPHNAIVSSVHSLCDSLRNLTFDDDCEFQYHLPFLTHITFGNQFNHPVDNLPPSLTHLTFGIQQLEKSETLCGSSSHFWRKIRSSNRPPSSLSTWSGA